MDESVVLVKAFSTDLIRASSELKASNDKRTNNYYTKNTKQIWKNTFHVPFGMWTNTAWTYWRNRIVFRSRNIEMDAFCSLWLSPGLFNPTTIRHFNAFKKSFFDENCYLEWFIRYKLYHRLLNRQFRWWDNFIGIIMSSWRLNVPSGRNVVKAKPGLIIM